MHANLYISVALSRNTSLHVEEPSQIYKKKKNILTCVFLAISNLERKSPLRSWYQLNSSATSALYC